MKSQTLTPPLVSVILAHLNSAPYIENLLRSLLLTDYPNLEIVFIDDGSTDGSFEIAESLLSKTSMSTIHRNIRRLGLAASRNVGIDLSKGDILVFIEADMEFEPSWLRYLVFDIMNDPDAGAAQPVILDLLQKNTIQAYSTLLVPHFCWYVNLGLGKRIDQYVNNSNYSFGFAVGLAVLRTVFFEIGNFDEQIEHNLSDTDLCWRIWLSGRHVVVARQSIVYHQTFKPSNARLNYISLRRWEFDFGKSVRIMIKNFGTRNLAKYLPWATAAALTRTALALFRRENQRAAGILESLWWNIRMLPDTYQNRRYVQDQVRRVPDKALAGVMLNGNFAKVLLRYRDYRKDVSEMWSGGNPD